MNGPLTEILDVTVKIFRMDGKLLWTHQQNFRESGLKSIPWSGCDSFGVPLPSGVYYAFVTMTGDGGDPFRKTIKVAILR